MLEVVVATVIGTVFGSIILTLIALGWRKGASPRVCEWWWRLQWRRRERAIRQLQKAVAKKLQSDNTPLFIDCRQYETALSETHRDRLFLFSGFQLDARITTSDYKIARALETLAEERTLHKVMQERFGGYAGARPQYVFSYHSKSEASYDAEQQLLELEAACMKHNSNNQGFSDACPKPRYQLYNASDEPNTTKLAVKKREDGLEHCARCWETQH